MDSEYRLEPMICPVCGEIDPLHWMVNTIQCLEEGCEGIMIKLIENIGE